MRIVTRLSSRAGDVTLGYALGSDLGTAFNRGRSNHACPEFIHMHLCRTLAMKIKSCLSRICPEEMANLSRQVRDGDLSLVSIRA